MTAATAAVDAGVQRLAAQLQAKRAQIDRQLQALAQVQQRMGAGTEPGPEVLLVLYLGMPSARAVAEFCNAQGWRLPGAKGPRKYQPPDVYELVRCGADGVGAELLAMARQKLEAASVMAADPRDY